MGIALFDIRPLNVLVDRSRDQSSGYAVVRLAPPAVFRVTESLRRISAQLLRSYGVLAICGTSAERYGDAELDSIERFVRRGGTLVLASCAEQFEMFAGRPATRLAQNAVAARFGYRFASAAGLPRRPSGLRAFSRGDLELTPAGLGSGLRLGDCWLAAPAPLSVPPRATVLLRSRKGHTPVMAMSRHGRGRVLVCHDLEMWNTNISWAAAHWVALAAPSERVATRGELPDVLRSAEKTAKRGLFRYRTTAATRGDRSRVQALAEPIARELLRIVRPGKRPKAINVEVVTGCGVWTDWWPEDELSVHVGTSLSDAGLVSQVTRAMAERLLWPRISGDMRTFIQEAADYLRVRMLRKHGHGELADTLESAWAGGAPADVSRVYSEVEPPLLLRRFWLDVEKQFGPRAFDKFCAALPKENPGERIDWSLFSHLDGIAYYLGRAVGPRIYSWLESQGHRVRRLPNCKPKSKAMKRATRKLLEGTLTSRSEPASDRYDAAVSLAQGLAGDKVGLDKCARAAQSRNMATALPAAVRLAVAKDARGPEALRRWLRGTDRGLCAVSALAMVYEAGDPAAADVLVRLTPRMEVRFQLSAGYALRLMGDRRAGRFAFEKLKGCEVRRIDEGMIKAFPTVEGHEVANVWCMPMVRPAAYGQGYSTYYVQWVHTSPRWRRRGLARIGMAAALDDHWDRACCMTSLHTGTRNVAHALYRDYGLIDYYRSQMFEKVLSREDRSRPPAGVVVRRANGRDLALGRPLVSGHYAGRPIDRQGVSLDGDSRLSFVALQKGKVVGVASAGVRRPGASLDHFATAEVMDKKGKPDGKAREQAGAAVLSMLHRALIARKVKTVGQGYWQPTGNDQTYWMLRRAGYGSRETGGVELYRLNSLQQYLAETTGTIERRLADNKGWADWRGSVLLTSPAQSALIKIDAGKVKVSDAPTDGERPTITIRADQAVSLQRLVTGISSCFQEYLQIQIDASPLVNDATRDLLDTVFPRMIAR